MVTVGIFPFKENSHGRTGNRTRDLMISSQKLRPLDHEAGQLTNILISILTTRIPFWQESPSRWLTRVEACWRAYKLIQAKCPSTWVDFVGTLYAYARRNTQYITTEHKWSDFILPELDKTQPIRDRKHLYRLQRTSGQAPPPPTPSIGKL